MPATGCAVALRRIDEGDEGSQLVRGGVVDDPEQLLLDRQRGPGQSRLTGFPITTGTRCSAFFFLQNTTFVPLEDQAANGRRTYERDALWKQ